MAPRVWDFEITDDGFSTMITFSGSSKTDRDEFPFTQMIEMGLDVERKLMHTLIERAKARGEHLTL